MSFSSQARHIAHANIKIKVPTGPPGETSTRTALPDVRLSGIIRKALALARDTLVRQLLIFAYS